MSQRTINKLVLGDAYGSKHLHRIARELGTTPAYLTGETDDPDEDAPPEPALSHNERELIACYGALGPVQQAALLTIAMEMAGRGGGAGRAHGPKAPPPGAP